ncbi:phosphotransferase [Ferrimonas balearica]|uniref:phosphotransferase n=1 Tax=Ferrimonas balearica TaxID=44012 RepID=UPI001C578EBC|nr:phosphotransferase [Ferrimonas balearica]MBW3163374.1 ecdysteroid 22-kinase family protein [Ferrimonas balearica]
MSQHTALRLGKYLGQNPPRLVDTLQSLWSGYGAIERWQLDDGRTIIVKRIAPPNEVHHPRGWHSEVGHQRKLTSYQVEQHWYQHFSPAAAHWPITLGTFSEDGTTYLLLSDLDAEGFTGRPESLSPHQITLCLEWLAQFHARFLNVRDEQLWQRGGYWHLATRQEEWQRMQDASLKRAAAQLDRSLANARWQTLVHGDAKVANFCFGADRVAAVDFQYVGHGAGVVDLAYFLGSELDGPRLAAEAEHWLDYYFSALQSALSLTAPQWADLESEWRQLYPVAVADFARFLDGWAPEHWKINDYSRAIVSRLLAEGNFFTKG